MLKTRGAVLLADLGLDPDLPSKTTKIKLHQPCFPHCTIHGPTTKKNCFVPRHCKFKILFMQVQNRPLSLFLISTLLSSLVLARLKWRQLPHVPRSPGNLSSHVTSKPWKKPHPFVSSVCPVTRKPIPSHLRSGASIDRINGWVLRLIASISSTRLLLLLCLRRPRQLRWIPAPRSRRRSASSTAPRPRRSRSESQPSPTRSSYGASRGGRCPSISRPEIELRMPILRVLLLSFLIVLILRIGYGG